MVFVECGSCFKTVEIDDGEYGTYECPYCQSEFGVGDPSNEDYNDTFNVAIVGVFFLAFSAVMIALFFSTLEHSDWEETEGEITGIDYATSYDRGYDFTYEVDGKIYNGSDGYMCPDGSRCTGYKVGDSVVISYNPYNPIQSEILGSEYGDGAVLFCCFSIPVLVLGSMLYGRAVHGQKISSVEQSDNPS